MQRLQQYADAARKLLNVAKDYDLRTLSRNYRTAALRVHPDRGGDVNEFNRLTKAYMLLVDKYKRQQSGRPCEDLRAESRREIDDQAKRRGGRTSDERTPVRLMQGDKFDVQLFNKIYAENRIAEPTDDGYGAWLDEQKQKPVQEGGVTISEKDETSPVFSSKFNLNVFNSAFEQLKDEDDVCNQQLIKRDAPEALVQYAGENTAFSNLGVEAMDDFSGTTTSGLHFTDIKKAHVQNNLINAKRVGYTQHRTVEDLESHRGEMSFDMTPEDIEREASRAKQAEMAEEQRRERVYARDQLVADQHDRLQQLLLH